MGFWRFVEVCIFPAVLPTAFFRFGSVPPNRLFWWEKHSPQKDWKLFVISWSFPFWNMCLWDSHGFDWGSVGFLYWTLWPVKKIIRSTSLCCNPQIGLICRQNHQSAAKCSSWIPLVVVSNIFYFHPYLGKIPILTNIFQMGWNHQLVIMNIPFKPRKSFVLVAFSPDAMLFWQKQGAYSAVFCRSISDIMDKIPHHLIVD